MNLKPHPLFAALLLSVIVFNSAQARLLDRKSNLSREVGAIYLEDFTKERVRLLAIHQVPIYATSQGKRAIGTLKKGKEVELVALNDKVYQIRGAALHGRVKGWVNPKAVASMEKDFEANIRKAYERQLIVQEMIKNNEIALGMTLDEVTASMGKPSRKSSKLTKEGRQDVFEYITYERVPEYRTGRDAYGNLIRQKYYVKVESGKLTVSFKDEMVESIEETEGEPLGGGEVKIVPIPIDLY